MHFTRKDFENNDKFVINCNQIFSEFETFFDELINNFKSICDNIFQTLGHVSLQ